MTIVGEPAAVLEAAFRGARTAYELIDMRRQRGEHPRMGAVDVVPFIPISDVTMEECVALSRRFGQRVGKELGVPVYLYEEAQDQPHRKALSRIRKGEYEGLADRIIQPEWAPDFGPADFVPRSGATVTGARFFLIAYNVNILGTRSQAHRLALNVREQGRTVKGPDGEPVRDPGYFEAVKAIGWELQEFGIAQVSMNLDDYRITSLHEVFEAIRRDAAELGVAVVGSEIVGLVPLEAMLMAADHYIEKEDLVIPGERQKVRLAIDRLGLSSIHPFRPEKKILEYRMARDDDRPRVESTVREFLGAVASPTPAPGGGSVAALVGSLGAALGVMGGRLTAGRKKYEHLDAATRQNLPTLIEIQEELFVAVDADADAYTRFMEALRLPKDTEPERAARREAMQHGLREAILVPLRTMELVDRAWAPMLHIARVVRYSARTDVEVGARALEACLYGTYRNVLTNLSAVEDPAFSREAESRARALFERGTDQFAAIREAIDARSGDV